MESNLPSLSQAFTIHHPNVFALIISLSEGRAGIAWVPSNKMLFLPPTDIKRISLSLRCFVFASTLPLSFLPDSLRFQRVKKVECIITNN
jgi:hypothetical protein